MISRLPEINIPYQTPTQWGTVAVVERLRPDERLVKAVQIPYPSMVSKMGIWVPERRGECRLLNGERFHQIDWEDIVTGGGNSADRRHIQSNGITAVIIPIRYVPNEYHSLLSGRGLLFRR